MNSSAFLTNSNQRSALVTGATGFVGSHLTRRLVSDGWQVHILSRADSRIPDISEFSQVINHVCDGSTERVVRCVELAKPDVVFHLASLALSEHEHKDIEPLIQSNVLFGSQLLEAMKINGVNCLVNTGTYWQHYENEDYNPVCLYAASKQAFESIMEYYVKACGINAITLILFDTYGSDDLRPKILQLLNKAAKSGESLDMSAGKQLIDLVHINDVIEVYMLAAQRLLDGLVSKHVHYAVSSGNPLSLKELVGLYLDVTGQFVKINWGARQYRHREVMVPWSRGVLIDGWTQKIKLDTGLREFAKHRC